MDAKHPDPGETSACSGLPLVLFKLVCLTGSRTGKPLRLSYLPSNAPMLRSESPADAAAGNMAQAPGQRDSPQAVNFFSMSQEQKVPEMGRLDLCKD